MDTSQQVTVIPKSKEASVAAQRQRRSIAEKRRMRRERGHILYGVSLRDPEVRIDKVTLLFAARDREHKYCEVAVANYGLCALCLFCVLRN